MDPHHHRQVVTRGGIARRVDIEGQTVFRANEFTDVLVFASTEGVGDLRTDRAGGKRRHTALERDRRARCPPAQLANGRRGIGHSHPDSRSLFALEAADLALVNRPDQITCHHRRKASLVAGTSDQRQCRHNRRNHLDTHHAPPRSLAEKLVRYGARVKQNGHETRFS